MATDAASSETTAKVLRATAGQVRLQLEGGREVAKRVTVPISVRESIVGTSVPVVVTGTGDRAKVDLAENWLEAAAPAKKPAAKRRARTGGDEAAAEAPAEKKPAAKRRRSGGAEQAATEPAAKPARRPRAKKASPEEAPVADPAAETEATEAPKKRTRSRGKKAAEAEVEAPAAETPAVPEAPVEEAPVEATPVEAATPGESPSIAEEPKPKRSRSRSRGGRGRKSAAETPEAATAESPGKADIPVAEPAAEPAAAETPAPAAAAPAAVAVLDPEVLRKRIADAVELVRAARAA